jgi:3-hydroxyacyl-CoA dehydrogenase
MAQLVDFAKRGAIGVITVNNPPVNALSVGVPEGIVAALEKGIADDTVAALVLVGGGRTFIAGADISEFFNPPAKRDKTIHDVIAALESSPKIVVAGVHGTALGGGLEVALGCHYRCGVADARFGLPEVKLGLLPGAGGTQRLPRLIGAEAALPLIASGDFVPADRALELGIIDLIVQGDIESGAVDYAQKLVDDGKPLRKVRDLAAKPPAKASFWDDFAKSIERRARGELAPFNIIACVRAAVELPFDEGITRERALFRDCHQSEQARGLIHLFFAERTASKIPDVPRETPIGAMDKVAVIGAGTMGGGIAMNFLNAGIPVTLVETDQAALDRGLATIRRNYEASAAKGRMSAGDVEARMALLAPTLRLEDAGEADIVIEAVFEEMDVKKDVFAKLDRVAKPGAVLATNTSTLDINEIAAATSRPEQVIGTHFFSPANVMRLLENVRGAKSSKETVATVMAMAKRIGKVAVLVGVCDGFVGNRMLAHYLRQAYALLLEGALPQQVDKALYDFGLAMGPFAMSDLAGLDVGWRIRKRRMAEQGSNESEAPIEDKLAEMGRFGQKTGAGWYLYEDGSRTPKPDPEVEQMIAAESEALGVARRDISDAEIVERCMFQLVNEGAHILEEGIALRAGDIDVVYANGYGFPRHRGGPMFYADRLGLKPVYDAVSRYHDAHGEAWRPAPLLARLAGEGKTFNDDA